MRKLSQLTPHSVSRPERKQVLEHTCQQSGQSANFRLADFQEPSGITARQGGRQAGHPWEVQRNKFGRLATLGFTPTRVDGKRLFSLLLLAAG